MPGAKLHAATPPGWVRRAPRTAKPRLLEPVPEHSDPTDDDSGNLLIEGDNRQATVSLLPQFATRSMSRRPNRSVSLRGQFFH